MFEELAQGDALAHVDDAALVDAIAGWTRAAAAEAGHRMAAIAELTDRRGAAELADERQDWACDAWDARPRRSRRRAGSATGWPPMRCTAALALRDRLPRSAS